GSRLFALPGPPRASAWAANVWLDPVRIQFGSLGEGARALAKLGRNWALLPSAHQRRAASLAQLVPGLPAKPRVFPSPPPMPIGSWTLVEPDAIVAAARCS